MDWFLFDIDLRHERIKCGVWQAIITLIIIKRFWITILYSESIFDATVLNKKFSLSIFPSLRKKCLYSEIFWFAFSQIRDEYGNLLCKSPYLVQMRESTHQKNSEYEHFLHSAFVKKTVELIKMDHNYPAISNTQNYGKVKFHSQNYLEYWKWRQNKKFKLVPLWDFIIVWVLNLD